MSRSLAPRAAVLAAVLAAPAVAQYVAADHQNPPLLGVDDAEFTPDGRLVVARDNTQSTSAVFYDAATGAQLAYHLGSGGAFSGPCQDGVVCTDDHAVVIGSRAMFFDLNNLPAGPFAVHPYVETARDVALTPDGTTVAVRSGQALNLYDLASGAVLATHPGSAPDYQPFEFEVDSVVVTDEHAVFTSEVGGNTRVTIFDLFPPSGPPAVVFETTASSDQQGPPHDLCLTPDGRFAAVRSDSQIGLYGLSQAASTQLWLHTVGNGDGFGGSAMDSVVATNSMVATISRRVTAGIGARVDVYELPGGNNFNRLVAGDPHDLELTPNGERLLVRTSRRVFLFDVANPSALLPPLDEVKLGSNVTGFGAGLDSLAVNADRVLAIARKDNQTRVRVYDISADALDVRLFDKWDERPVDVAITPDGEHGVVTGVTGALVIDLRLNEIVLDHDPHTGGNVPWCDGVAVTDDQAFAFGAVCCPDVAGGGWLSAVDLFSRAESYCPTNPNSTGLAGRLVATGSSRAAANDLTLNALQLPGGEFGQFVYGDGQQHKPFGDGFVCVKGQVARFPVQQIAGAGTLQLAVDNQGLPPGGGALLPGSTWNFQLVHRDTASPGGFNLTDAVSVLFE